MELRILFGPGDRPDPALVDGGDHPDHINCGSGRNRELLFAGPEWKLDGGPEWDNAPTRHEGPLEGGSSPVYGHFQNDTILFTGPEWNLDSGGGWEPIFGPPEGGGSHAHFGPFDPPAPLQYGPPEGDGYPERSSFGPGEGNGMDFTLGPPDGWGTVLH